MAYFKMDRLMAPNVIELDGETEQVTGDDFIGDEDSPVNEELLNELSAFKETILDSVSHLIQGGKPVNVHTLYDVAYELKKGNVSKTKKYNIHSDVKEAISSYITIINNLLNLSIDSDCKITNRYIYSFFVTETLSEEDEAKLQCRVACITPSPIQMKYDEEDSITYDVLTESPENKKKRKEYLKMIKKEFKGRRNGFVERAKAKALAQATLQDDGGFIIK